MTNQTSTDPTLDPAWVALIAAHEAELIAAEQADAEAERLATLHGWER